MKDKDKKPKVIIIGEPKPDAKKLAEQCFLHGVSSSASPMFDWNTLSLDEMVEYLRQKYMFSSTGDAKCIYHLIEFYDKHK
jgi:hypothetical protein